jgi:hypothetical protein
MQKPRFKTSEKAAWVFIHTRLRPSSTKPTMDRRTAARSGYLLAASRKLNRPEKDLPLPFVGETISTYVARVSK